MAKVPEKRQPKLSRENTSSSSGCGDQKIVGVALFDCKSCTKHEHQLRLPFFETNG
jgi:hypothetical protein